MLIRPQHLMAALAALALMLASAGSSSLAADLKGSADHPLVPRYENSVIVAYAAQAYARKTYARAPVSRPGGLDKNPDAALALEGKLTSITYRAPADRSALEVARNYQTALEAAGFSVVYACGQAACGGRTFNHALSPRNYYMGFGEYHAEQEYLLARLARPEGEIYASVYVVLNQSGGGPDRRRSLAQVDVLELKPMETRMVTLNAEEMDRSLGSEGRVAVYGLLFDTDKDTMRADSRPQLEEIAQLLKNIPALKVLIVGHTDSQGGLDYNRDLSLRRARSVVSALVKDFGIQADRLIPQGVGMAAPLASNRDAAGRAKNRRVELVELAQGQ